MILRCQHACVILVKTPIIEPYSQGFWLSLLGFCPRICLPINFPGGTYTIDTWTHLENQNEMVQFFRCLIIPFVVLSCPVMSDSVIPWTVGPPVPHHLLKLIMPSSHLILWCPLILLPSIFPSIRDFSNESAVRIRWPKYCSFSFSISPSSEYSGLTGLISLLSKTLSEVFSSTTVWKHQFFGSLPSLWSSSHNCTWTLGRP